MDPSSALCSRSTRRIFAPKASGKHPALFKELEELKSYRFSLYISNDEELGPEEIWRGYRPRANDENVVKDLKEGYGFACPEAWHYR